MSERPLAPYFILTDAQKKWLWDDGLHLKAAGYRLRGESIAAKLIELLQVVKQPMNDRGLDRCKLKSQMKSMCELH